MDIGVQPLPIPVPQQLRHRVTGVIVDSPGLVKHILLSVYAVPRLGLQGDNVRLLGWIAELQDAAQLPLVSGGDFNFEPLRLADTDYTFRSGISAVAPSGPTYFTKGSQRTLDWFLVSEVFTRLIQNASVHTAAQLSPHRPVSVQIQLSESTKIPVLTMPQRLPRRRPFGPAPELPPWDDLQALASALEASLVQ